MAFGREKGSKKAPDGKFYGPDDPIWATFKESIVTATVTPTADEAQAKALEVINADIAKERAVAAAAEKQKEASDIGQVRAQETEVDRIILHAQKDFSDAPPVAPLTQLSGEDAEKARNQGIVDGWLKAQEESERREQMWEHARRTGEPIPPVSMYQRQGALDPSKMLDKHGKSLVPPGCVGLFASMEDREGKPSSQEIYRELARGARVILTEDGLPYRTDFGTGMYRTIEKSVELQVAATREKVMREDADPQYLKRISRQQNGPVIDHGGFTSQDIVGDDIDDLDTFFKKEDEENARIAKSQGLAFSTGRDGETPQQTLNRMAELIASR